MRSRYGMLGVTLALFALTFAAAQDEEGSEGIGELLALMEHGLADRSDKWICEPETQYVCSLDGCHVESPTVWVHIDFSSNQYSRCDTAGCDAYLMETWKGGAFTSVVLPGRTTLLKAMKDGSEYVEILTTGLATIQNFGACRASR